MSNDRDFVQQMNELGSKRIPFLFVIDYAMQKPWVMPLAEINPQELLYDMRGNANSDGFKPTTDKTIANITFHKKPVSLAYYAQAFNHVMQQLQAGNSFLVNLTLPTLLETNLSLQQIFYNSTAAYKLWWNKPLRGNPFVVFSPETFVTIRDGHIHAHPMKGTINSALPDARQRLLDDPKELAEHVTIVDLIRNDMSMVATEVTVARFRYIDRITTHDGKELLQASTEIRGKLPENYLEKLGTILMAMLPAGSICGAPKPRTLQIIHEAERYERGYYTGVVGVFDGKQLDSGVMIRYIEQQGRTFYFKSGGGITALSDMQSEYQELIDKVYVPIQ